MKKKEKRKKIPGTQDTYASRAPSLLIAVVVVVVVGYYSVEGVVVTSRWW